MGGRNVLQWLFLACAVAGGTILVCQFALTLLGFAHLGGDHDFGDTAHHDVDGVDHIEAGHHGDGSHHDHHSGAGWLFAMFSLRTITAGAAFFGLGGLGAESMGQSPFFQVITAVALGVVAFTGVYYIVRAMLKLNTDNTVCITRAIGQRGVVYLTIPAQSSGEGKVQVTLASRQMEYPAITNWANPLKTGDLITVVSVVNNSTLEVAPFAGEK